jgi:hypothetical protein
LTFTERKKTCKLYRLIAGQPQTIGLSSGALKKRNRCEKKFTQYFEGLYYDISRAFLVIFSKTVKLSPKKKFGKSLDNSFTQNTHSVFSTGLKYN